MVELAAAKWNTTTAAALVRLYKAEIGLGKNDVSPESLTRNDKWLAKRNSAKEFWAAAQQHLVKHVSPTVVALRSKFRLNVQMSPERWKAGPGCLMGQLHNLDVERYFMPQSMVAGEQTRNPSGRRLFRGGNWDDVMVLPYYDVPGRITGFQFIGKQGRPEQRIFKPLAHANTDQEAGLHGLSTVDAAQTALGGHVLAIEDVTLALRLQFRQFNVSSAPLPIVSWIDVHKHRTSAAWVSLHRRVPVFWAWQMNHRMLFQAVISRGRISLAGPEEHGTKRVDHYFRLNSAFDTAKMVVRDSKPWAEALTEWVAASHDSAVEDLLVRLEGYPLDIRDVIKACGAQAPRMLSLLGVPAEVVQVRFSDYVSVEETENGWFCVTPKGRYLLSNAIIRVDKIVSKNEVAHYVGRILYRGRELPFNEPIRKIENSPSRWLRMHMMNKGVGCPILSTHKHVSLWATALRFHEPKYEITCRSNRPSPADEQC